MLLPFDEHVQRVRKNRPQPPAPVCVMVADQSVGGWFPFAKKHACPRTTLAVKYSKPFLYHTVPDAPLPPLSPCRRRQSKVPRARLARRLRWRRPLSRGYPARRPRFCPLEWPPKTRSTWLKKKREPIQTPGDLLSELLGEGEGEEEGLSCEALATRTPHVKYQVVYMPQWLPGSRCYIAGADRVLSGQSVPWELLLCCFARADGWVYRTPGEVISLERGSSSKKFDRSWRMWCCLHLGLQVAELISAAERGLSLATARRCP